MTIIENTSMTRKTLSHVAICDEPECTHRVGVKNFAAGAFELVAHKQTNCPMKPKRSYMLDETDEKGQFYTAPHLGKSIAEKLWDALDQMFAAYMNPEHKYYQDPETKGKCRGIAYGIQKMMPHYYATVDDVVKEEVKRLKIAKGEVEWQPTSGYKHNPPPPDSAAAEKYRQKMNNGPTPVKTTGSKSKTSQAAQFRSVDMTNEIKVKYATGMDPQEIAKQYALTPDELTAIVLS